MTRSAAKNSAADQEAVQAAGEDWKPTREEFNSVAKLDVKRRFDTETLAGITSFEEALKLAMEDGAILDSNELGDGFRLLDDKAKLVGLPFVIVDWMYGTNTDFGNPFVIIRLVTKNDEKYIITDGSTGLKRELETYYSLSAEQQIKSVMCRNGLRASDYWVSDDTGEIVPADYTGRKKKATTYYIAAT